jgi:hypothetical protein
MSGMTHPHGPQTKYQTLMIDQYQTLMQALKP